MAALALPRSAASRLLLRRSYGTVQNTILPAASVAPVHSSLQDAVAATGPRMNWTKEEIQKIYDAPLNELTYASVSTGIATLFLYFY